MTQSEEVIKKYLEGHSAQEISSSVGIGIKRVFTLLQKAGIQRRTPALSNALRYRRSVLSFQDSSTRRLSSQQEQLKIIALALYWGEGYKGKSSNTVDIANSDPSILKVFLRFLREVLKVDEQKLRVYLYCFTNQDISDLKQFWSQELEIPISQFQKPYIRSSGSSVRKMKYGLAHVRYSDKRLLEYLMKEIDQLKMWAGGRAVKCTRL